MSNVIDNKTPNYPKDNVIVKGLLLNYYTKDKIQLDIVFIGEKWLTSEGKDIPFDYDVLSWR